MIGESEEVADAGRISSGEPIYSRLIPAIGSKVCCVMFYGPNVKSAEIALTIPKYSAEVLPVVLQFLYSNRTFDMEWLNVMDVLKCAEHFVLNSVRKLDFDSERLPFIVTKGEN
ncbi:hypothetical protein RvY_10186 [Ramazzottius varieornatus]|uniref:BTB domain-containing protein n=1 Tax=Ramazzottius varieornatus TaxID=947166 RepID=A0A1D1VBY0_RAMVA|nr:hypothetical protein RvY_10186 [Ramazzottius varieornatus]